MIVNDTCVGGSVEYLGPTVSCQIVNTLVDVFVEADHPLEVLKGQILSERNLQVRFRSGLLLLRRIVARLRLHSAVGRPSCCNHCFGRTYFKF